MQEHLGQSIFLRSGTGAIPDLFGTWIGCTEAVSTAHLRACNAVNCLEALFSCSLHAAVPRTQMEHLRSHCIRGVFLPDY